MVNESDKKPRREYSMPRKLRAERSPVTRGNRGDDKRRRIAIVGGGLGSLAAAYALSKTPEMRDEFAITVYQMGWRLGGKGASGRGPAALGHRIEEHGLHLWMGHYEQSFRMLRDVYHASGRDPGAPLGSWRKGFNKLRHVVISEQPRQTGEGWKYWPFDFPFNSEEPGLGGALPSVWGYLERLLGVVYNLLHPLPPVREGTDLRELVDRLLAFRPIQAIRDYPHWIVEEFAAAAEAAMSAGRPLSPLPSLWNNALAHFEAVVGPSVNLEALADMSPALAPLIQPLGDAYTIVRNLAPEPDEHGARAHEAIVWLIDQALARSAQVRQDGSDRVRRVRLLVELYAIIARGMIVDGVIHEGFDVIDEWDLRAWLKHHGGSDELIGSACVEVPYGLLYAYERGDPQAKKLAAGVALNVCLRMVFAYKGAIFWRMTAGMGDVVFAPMYEALVKRGVKFEFFHKLENVVLSPDGITVKELQMLRQAEIVGGADYDPLIEVGGARCWPNAPRHEQLVEGEALAREGVNFESFWSERRGTPVTLRLLRDFDDVVLGTAIGSLPHVAREVLKRHPRWAAAVEHITTNQTFSVQLWLRSPVSALGWTRPCSVLATHADPLNVWADMSHLRAAEIWPEGQVESIAYFTGAFPEAEPPAAASDRAYPQRAAAGLKEAALRWFNDHATAVWPNFTWSQLVDAAEGEGEARLDAQYLRLNIDPSERYVLSPPGSTKHRLDAFDAGLTNLFPAGDWIHTGLNCGAVESAVIGGIRAAYALAGLPRRSAP